MYLTPRRIGKRSPRREYHLKTSIGGRFSKSPAPAALKKAIAPRFN
jgi:hypothetical protein